MRRRLSGLWTVINRPPCNENFDLASTRLQVGICSGQRCFYPELQNSCNS